MSGDDNRRAELASFLRMRRERIRPEQAGFPAGHYRRTRGLRREEVAVLAGVSPTWYAYLEQGRKGNVSPAVLDSIARVLQMSEDERRYMHRLAYGHVADLRPLEADIAGDDLVKLLVRVTDRSAEPVYATNGYGDLVAWNPAACEWYEDWGQLDPKERNMFRWLLTSPRARDRIIDWEADARDLVTRWRAAFPGWRTDERLRREIAEMASLNADFASWWEAHDVLEHRTKMRVFRHPRHGIRVMRLIIVQAPDFAPSIAVFHSPVE
jgi:transcriptional regulator with XRE-family HTH domain